MLAKVSEVSIEPGAGPRHVAFGPDGTMLYVSNELNATITALPYDADSGKLGEPVATVSTVPDDFPDAKSTAEILVHPSGDFLYGTNRRYAEHPAADSVAVFRLDEQGVPERVQLVTDNIAFARSSSTRRGPGPTPSTRRATTSSSSRSIRRPASPRRPATSPRSRPPVSLVFTTGG